MKHIIYYSPYIPIIGFVMPLILINRQDTCIMGRGFHFFTSAIWQGLCYATLICLINLK